MQTQSQSQSRKEVITAAIEFTKPDRLPVMFGRYGCSDVHGVRWNQAGSGDRSLNRAFDEWGCGWHRTTHINMGQVKVHPLGDWSALDAYNWPDPDNPALYEGMEERFEQAEDRYITTGIFMLLFERLQSLRGFEDLMADFYFERDKFLYNIF